MNILRWGLIGIVSGALSATPVVPDMEELGLPSDTAFYAMFIVPGLVFGVIIAIALMTTRRLHPGKAAAFVAASFAGNAAAFWLAFYIVLEVSPSHEQELAVMIAVGALAGSVGGGILGAVASWVLNSKAWLRFALVGAVAGISFPLFFIFETPGAFAFYMIWQGAYAAALAFCCLHVRTAAAASH